MNRKYLIGLIAVGLGAAAVVWLVFFRANPNQGTVKIGVVIPLTGPGAELGKLIKRGLELGAETTAATSYWLLATSSDR